MIGKKNRCLCHLSSVIRNEKEELNKLRKTERKGSRSSDPCPLRKRETEDFRPTLKQIVTKMKKEEEHHSLTSLSHPWLMF